MTVPLTDHDLSIEEYGKRAFLRPNQRQELERSVHDIEERLANPIVLELTGGNRDALEKQLGREKEMLARGTPPVLDAATTRKMVGKLKKCEDLIINGLPTFTMMERGRPADVDHFSSHQMARHHDEDGHYTTKRAILARQNYLLTLARESVEENALNVASLRTDTVRGDPGKFRLNFDHIRWREALDAEVEQALSDDEYHLFCGLKALEWTEATIRRKFDWPQRTYDLAMERWRKDVLEKSQTAPVSSTGAIPSPSSAAQQPPAPSVSAGRVHAPVGWPKDELKALGCSIGQFCRMTACHSGNFYAWTTKGLWPQARYDTAVAALEQLRRDRGAEPAEAEPASVILDEPLPVGE